MQVQKPQENFVALPLLQVDQPLFVDPLENALVALAQLSFKAGRVEQVHILGPVAVDERDDAAVAVVRQPEPGFLQHLAADAVLGALAELKLPSRCTPSRALQIYGRTRQTISSSPIPPGTSSFPSSAG